MWVPGTSSGCIACVWWNDVAESIVTIRSPFCGYNNNNNNNNNNNSHDNVYGAVIMIKDRESSPGHLMNVVWAPGGRQPSDQASRLGLWVRRKLAAIIHIHHRPWADTHFAVPRRVKGWVDLSTAVKVHSPCSRLYISAAVAINTTVSGVVRTWVLSHRSQTR